ncbi:hypothetical protein Tco_1349743 [Tanacetum coccineum]
MPIEPSGHAESPSLDVELALTDSETESDEEVPPVNLKKDASYRELFENLKLPTKDQVILEEPTSSTRTLSSLQNLDKELNFTNQFLMEKTQEEEPEKTNTESEVHPGGKVGQNGYWLYKLENLNIPQQVSKVVDEIVMDAVDWAMQALLRARFSDLPTVDMKEILQQWMFKDNSYKAHKVHDNLFEALEKSLERDYSNQLLKDVDEARMKKRKRRTHQELLLGLLLYSHLLHICNTPKIR